MHLVVIGDALLDRDISGDVHRVCPDAPAPVLDVGTENARPGGAGLAAAMLAHDGHDVTLIAPVAADASGDLLTALLRAAGVQVIPIPVSAGTRVKTRVRAAGQTLVRLDSGHSSVLAGDLPAAAADALRWCDGILVSDYAGGMTALPTARRALADATALVPVVWDPHPRGTAPVPGVCVVTPNAAEAAGFAGIGGTDSLAAAARAADALVHTWRAGAVCVTLGRRGAVLSYGAGIPMVVGVREPAHGDVCGAGDRFAAELTVRLASGSTPSDAVADAVDRATAFVADGEAGGFTREHMPTQLQAETNGGRTLVATGGCFDLVHAGHVALLAAARALGDRLVVCLNSDASVARLKGADRPLVPVEDRRRVLTALECVDEVVVFDEDTPAEILRRIRPDIWVKGGDYAHADLPEAPVLAEWGGRAVALPFLPGRSTTSLIARAGGRA